MMRRDVIVSACLLMALWAVGCKVHVEKDASGEDKKVQVDTPFGGIHVNTGQTTAADVGLPAYPGAQVVTHDDDHNSADVRLGFGEWAMHVQVASYSTADDENKVADFYRKALRSYGDVIACRNGAPAGAETKTAGGLTCSEHGHPDVSVRNNGKDFNYQWEHGGYELKAGTQRHQHIVAFDKQETGKTRFALVALDLPASDSSGQGKSD